ncbi:MAG: [Fe-Fe] hydrogenase large subunit C-terminal domain-containing protein [Bacillota bacterium]|jgi:PAS domain S-box-containing protein
MGLIETIKASCRDCYKCVRYCPVKAIRVNDNHAEVVAERCIADGRCVTICPQSAKKVESAVAEVQTFLQADIPIAASLAPSFVAAFDAEPGQLVAALKCLGFEFVTETAEGAELVAAAHLQLLKKGDNPVITSCCPAIVNLIEIYYPNLLLYLAPVLSPMAAHAAQLKKRYGPECKVVFIGPCIAKKGEARDEANVDAVLTFGELQDMLTAVEAEPAGMDALPCDGPGADRAHIFPAPGGLAGTAALSTDLLAKEIVTIDGLEESIAFLNNFAAVKANYRLIELLACRGGCINGPGMPGETGLYQRRERLLSYAQQKRRASGSEWGAAAFPDLSRAYSAQMPAEAEPTESVIKAILARTGKLKPEDELNCGACGYNSCREKAVAVAKGLAEIDMCIPYMRAKAESRAGLIFEMSPNAIFVVDRDLVILEANPKAQQKFQISREAVSGMKLAALIDPKYFQEALATKRVVGGEVTYPAYNLVAWQSIVYLEKEEVLIGIFSDITKEREQSAKLDRMTEETLEKAQAVINKQMRVAQEIAGLLGETTAETKVSLTKLMRLIQNEAGKGR